ncbi:MAG: molybdenum cofactor sulfurase [Devosiaceae bacterium]|nr:molybdenum cofactor sulfurase [Devosiaceae bacterium MH13]
MSIYSAKRFEARVEGLFASLDGDRVSKPVDVLDLTYEGIDGDRHGGLTRKTGGREPWHPRGTEIRNERQLSMVDAGELAEAAAAMGIERIAPEWVGANMLLEGIPNLSMLPPRSLLHFASGATIRIDGQNAPCRFAGASIAENYPDHDANALALAFPKAAAGKRGLVGWVERPGTVQAGTGVTVQVPQQWIWDGP